jgi:hypothetical protein
MITETTKEIMYMVDEAEERKKSMEAVLKRLQEQKRSRQFELLRHHLFFRRDEFNSGIMEAQRNIKATRVSNIIIDLNRRIVEQRNKFVRASKAVGRTLHWTSLSEHRSRRDRRKAAELARESAKI